MIPHVQSPCLSDGGIDWRRLSHSPATLTGWWRRALASLSPRSQRGPVLANVGWRSTPATLVGWAASVRPVLFFDEAEPPHRRVTCAPFLQFWGCAGRPLFLPHPNPRPAVLAACAAAEAAAAARAVAADVNSIIDGGSDGGSLPPLPLSADLGP